MGLKKITALIVLGLISLSLAGCNLRLIISDEERYSNINDVLEYIDYKNIGEITHIEYDKNNGFGASASWVNIKYSNSNGTAQKISDRLLRMPGVTCEGDNALDCRYEGVTFTFSGVGDNFPDYNTISLSFNDGSNGLDLEEIKKVG